MLRTNRTLAALFLCVAALASCAPKDDGAAAMAAAPSCPAAKPALEVMDSFMAAFNAKDTPGLEATFHYPHIRLASYPIQVLTGPGQQDDIFGNLALEDWARSGWEKRDIIQCSDAKAHIAATFARFHADGEEYSRYDGLYIIEFRDGFWGITIRSTFAP